MDLDFHLSDSMVAETNLEGASVAKGGADWSSVARRQRRGRWRSRWSRSQIIDASVALAT
ncbi:hypothetical protein OROMI_026012 [Orobanche minor]